MRTLKFSMSLWSTGLPEISGFVSHDCPTPLNVCRVYALRTRWYAPIRVYGLDLHLIQRIHHFVELVYV